jgi:voltage-gated sodium channel
MRVLRVLRLLTMVPSMRRVVGPLLAPIPELGSIGLVLLVRGETANPAGTHQPCP